MDCRDPIIIFEIIIIDTAIKCLVFEKIAFLHFGVKIQDGGSPPSDLGFWGSRDGFFEK